MQLENIYAIQRASVCIGNEISIVIAISTGLNFFFEDGFFHGNLLVFDFGM